MPPNIVLENQNNLAIGRNENPGLSSHYASVSMTEQKLNNYLQQAKYLMNNQQQFQPYQQNDVVFTQGSGGKNQTTSNQKRSQKMKNYSYDTEVFTQSNNKSGSINPAQLPAHVQNIYQLDSCPSSKILFNALDDFDEEDQRKIKASFSAQKKPNANKRLAKLEEQKKSLSDAKKNITSKQSTIKKQAQSASNQNLKGFQMHRNSQASRQSKASGAVSVKNADKISINQIVDQFDNIILEEQNMYGDTYDDDYQQQSYDGLRVLDYDQDENGNLQQMDLENIKSVNKRQASKTEVFTPAAFSQGLHKKNKGSNLPKPQQNINHSGSKLNKPSQVSTMHKKTTSQALVQDKSQTIIGHIGTGSQSNIGRADKLQPTRNQALNKKHMTTTTSPVVVKLPSESDAKLNKQTSLSAAKKVQRTMPTLPSPNKKGRNQNTVEIVEDQQEEEDHKSDQQSKIARFQLQQREFDIINQTISPSSASSFQFQPKFFKPTHQHRQSQDEPLTVRYAGNQEEYN